MRRQRRYMILILLSTLIMCIFVGCKGNALNDDLSSETESDSTDNNTESESEESTPQVKEFLDHTQEFPQYEIREIGIESILSEKEEVRMVSDMKIFDERIHLVVTTYHETYGFCDKLVTCNLSGGDLQSVVLQIPETESEVWNLNSFLIGMDGNVYAVKYEKTQTLWSCTEEGSGIVSWNMDGEIRFESKLKLSDFENYENPEVWMKSVTEEGELVFSISDYSKAIVVHTSSEGDVLDIHESEECGAFRSNWTNQDGSVNWLFSKGNRKEEYDMFYLTYDIDTQTFSDPIQVHDAVLYSQNYGIGQDALILCEEGSLFQYYPFEDKIEPFAQVGEGEGVRDVVAINDESFLIYFWNAMDDDHPFEGVYIYTLVIE